MNSLLEFQDNIMKANLKNIGKKIVSLIMLDFGLVFLEVGVRTPLLTYYISSTSAAELNISSIIFKGNALADTVIELSLLGSLLLSGTGKRPGKYSVFIFVSQGSIL